MGIGGLEFDRQRKESPDVKHWDKSLDRWFLHGVDIPGTAMIAVKAQRLHYWDGEDEGEVEVG